MTQIVAIATVVLGLVGASIALMQWRTAQQKVVLDILKTRYEIYEELVRIVGRFGETGKFPLNDLGLFLDTQRRARFHFGPEVDAYLTVLRHDMIRGNYFDRVGHQANISEDEYAAVFDRINGAYAELDRLFIPYMRISQRMPLWWWIDCRNRVGALAQKVRAFLGL